MAALRMRRAQDHRPTESVVSVAGTVPGTVTLSLRMSRPAGFERLQHATPATLDRFEHLLSAIRTQHPELREKSRGVFHLRGSAFLHFHEDERRVVADVGGKSGWQRMDVTGAAGRRDLLAAIGPAVALRLAAGGRATQGRAGAVARPTSRPRKRT